MLDAVYMPEPLENKPEWFNGFVHLETHPKEKYGWNRYVYLPDYFSDDIETTLGKTILSDSSDQGRFGIIKPKENNISKLHCDYFSRTETRPYSLDTKEQIGVKSLGAVTLLNAATGEQEIHRYLFANNNYIVRQLDKYDKPQFTTTLTRAGKDLEMFFALNTFSKFLDNGTLMAPISMEGEMHGIQTFTFVDNGASPEPLTYIDPEARQQGVFSIYHDAVIEFGEACGAEFIYAHCSIGNQKIQDVYESYGYIRQPGTRTVGTSDIRDLYTYHFPLKTQQQTLF